MDRLRTSRFSWLLSSRRWQAALLVGMMVIALPTQTTPVKASSQQEVTFAPVGPFRGKVGQPFRHRLCQAEVVPAFGRERNQRGNLGKALCGGSFNPTDNPSGGNPPYSFKYETMGGFAGFGIFLQDVGILMGTPTRAGTESVRICAIDSSRRYDCQNVIIIISPADDARNQDTGAESIAKQSPKPPSAPKPARSEADDDETAGASTTEETPPDETASSEKKMSSFELAMWGVVAASASVAAWELATLPQEGDGGDFDFSLFGDAGSGAGSCSGCGSGSAFCEASWGNACCSNDKPHYGSDGKCYRTFPSVNFVLCGCPVF